VRKYFRSTRLAGFAFPARPAAKIHIPNVPYVDQENSSTNHLAICGKLGYFSRPPS
jgi:hypothetical protein